MLVPPREISLTCAVREWWKDGLTHHGFLPTLGTFLLELWGFLRDSTGEQRRRGYGDVEYDCDYHVDTTSATVGLRHRLLGIFHSPYQPTEPALFHEMMAALKIDYRQFTFIDLGSGKGRALLMAADYPFRRILGVELLPELHAIAQENVRRCKSHAQKCFVLESRCADALEFVFPPEPTVLYLFNPFPESVLEQVITHFEQSLHQNPRPAHVLYHNPLLEHVLNKGGLLKKIIGTQQFAVYANGQTVVPHRLTAWCPF